MSVAARKEKWIRFMQRDPRVNTLVMVNVPSATQRPFPNPDNLDARITWAADEYQRQMEMLFWLQDDRVPFVSPYTGTEVFAEAFGCDVHRPEDNMPFALPRVRSIEDLKKVKPVGVDSPPLARCFELMTRLREKVGKDAVWQLPDIQSPLDIAALIWEKVDFFMAMLDEPGAVKDLVAMTEETLTAFLDAWFRAFGHEYIAHYPSYYMTGGLTLSEDEIGAISPAQFEEFSLDSLNRLSRRFGGIGIHSCSDSFHQWAGLKKIEGLRLLNLVRADDVLAKAFQTFEAHCCQMHNFWGDGKPNLEWLKVFPQKAHIAIEVHADDRRQAMEKLKALREIEAARTLS